MSMTCPHCGSWTTVKETRTRKIDNLVTRRYECGNLHRFSTEERIKDDELLRRLRELQSRPGLPSPGGESWAAYEIR
jgi:transcriptional regulator NrdR family protein